jgi:hypothetical protein
MENTCQCGVVPRLRIRSGAARNARRVNPGAAQTNRNNNLWQHGNEDPNVRFGSVNADQLTVRLASSRTPQSGRKNRMKAKMKTRNALCGLMLIALLLPGAANAREQIYVAEFTAHRVGKYDATTGAAIDANFIVGLADPVDFAVRGNDLFVLDRSANRVRRYDARTGAVINANFAITSGQPGGIVFNGNDMFLTQYAGSNVARYDATTGALINPTFITGIAGTSWGIQISGNDLYVAEINAHRVRRHNATTGALINANFISQPNYPFGLNVSGSDLFVASLNGPLGRYNVATGTLIYAITGLNGPVDVEKYGNDLFVVESGANRVRRHDAATGALISANFITVLSPPHGMAIRSDIPPTANAGVDFSVNEGQTGVMLDASLSSDPENDPLTYAWVQLPGGPAVTLTGADTAGPSFTAPTVAPGGETLTFKLSVTAYGETAEDTVDITVVNVNHPPVADAGLDQSIAEGSPVTLHGEDSFDIDNDVFTYAWVQVSGSPTVTITGADSANPTFTAPVVAGSGAPGVVATLVFELTVNDGFPQNAPAPGYTLANVVDSVTVEISNVNNDPVAAAGADQTVDEFTSVTLNGTGSSDPDSDPLTYVWRQTGGPAVLDLLDDTAATPSFIVPFVSSGGADVTFELTVDDGYSTATDTVVVHVQNANDPPLVTAAVPTIGSLWPPNHNLVSVGITGVSDSDNNTTITITGVTQDEPTNGTGDGDTAIDAFINANGTVFLRAERSGNGNGRVYHIHFKASDLEGSASGVVKVTVPHSKKAPAIDGGELYDSTQ